MKAIFINSAERKIEEREVAGVADLQQAVGGLIEVAHDINPNNTIYVNEEGLFQGTQYGFVFAGAHQPFFGNGIVVGFNPETGKSKSTTETIESIKAKLKFFSDIALINDEVALIL